MPEQLESLETTVVRINTRLVVVAVTLLALLVGGSVVSRRLFLSRATRGLRESARRQYSMAEEEQRKQGLRELMRYVQMVPSDVEAKLELANWLLEIYPEAEAGEAALQ
ncbi:MAG: hypothetical protein ACKO3P_11175, partial [Planctomycetaceae bacterium]